MNVEQPLPPPPAHSLPLEEVASTLAMCVIATWTVSTSAHRALSMRGLLRDSGEAQPVVDQRSAMCLPFISSAALLTMYFLFSYLQSFLVCYMAVASFGAVSMCLYEPLALHWSPFVTRLRCARLSLTRDAASYVAAALATSLVLTWIMTSHWAVLDVLGVCITISVVSLIRLPSLKIAAIVLVSLFFYDIFWVFLSPYFFASNVMVEVATKTAANPAQAVGDYMNVPGLKDAAPSLQLPIKLMFPAGVRNGSPIFHMLGLGDMAIPGIFVAFALAFDKFNEEQQEAAEDDESLDALLLKKKDDFSGRPKHKPYFRAARLGYVVGIVLSIAASQFFGAAQPALLYLVPAVLTPLLMRARRLGHFALLWKGFELEGDEDDYDDAAAEDDDSNAAAEPSQVVESA